MNTEQPLPTEDSKRKIIATLAVLLVIVLIVLGASALKTKPNSESATPGPNPTATTPSATSNNNPNTPASNSYKDGSYTATGEYNSPGGQQSITVTVSLKDGVISDTSAQSGAKDPTAKEFQADFIGGYKDQVVGKSIDDVRLSRVSGSSLTSKGFNDAIAEIRNKAKA